MKTVYFIAIGLMLLLAGSEASAQRQRQRGGGYGNGNFGGYGGYGGGYNSGGEDPRTINQWPNSRYGTNGFDIISANNIFDPNRIYVRRNTNVTVVIPSYTFSLNGAMTYGPNDTGFAFFDGNSVSSSRGYTTAETINGFKISEITNNTVVLADTNNKTFTLTVGSGFSKYGTNDWKFRPVPDASAYVPSATATDDTSDSSDAGPSGPVSDVMRRLMEKRKAELGDAAAPAGGGDNAAPAPGDAPPPPPGPAGGDAPAPVPAPVPAPAPAPGQ